MKNKKLNIIGILAVMAMIAIAIFALFENRKENNMLGKFNLNALENAQPRVNDAVKIARDKVEQLVAIQDKTYMNFVRPLMDIDAALGHITGPIYHLNSVNNSEETQKIVDDITPVMSDYSSDMSRHKGIYNGMLAVREKEYDSLNDAQKKVLDDAIKAFKIAGVDLPADKQARLKEISAQLSKLSNDFTNNIIAANKLNKIKITDEAVLGEMMESDKAAAKTDDGWEFSLLAPSYVPFMGYVTDRNLREEMYKNFVTRAPENEEIIPEILKLHEEQAKILGYKNFAELAFEFRDAESPMAAEKYLFNIVSAAKPAAEKEFAELKEFSKIDLQPWDYAFYSRLLKKEKYSVSPAETRPYFEMDATIDATMDVIAEMFDIKFKERRANIWHKDVKYFDIIRDDKVIAGLYLDLQTRESKRGGAWANDFALHHIDANGHEHLAEGVVCANFPVATSGNPSLLSLNDFTTLLHEMGHAVHLLLSTVDEQDLSGFNVDWDVVEFPSQFLESFWLNPTVLKKVGRHYQTGEQMPDELINRIIAADRFQKGMFLVRQLEFGIFDLELYQKSDLDTTAVQKVLDAVRTRVAVIKYPEYNKFQNTFTHIFGGGYAAGYYSYLWAESLAADAYLAFDGNPFNKDLAIRYRDTVLALGDTKPMSQLYKDFLGRAPRPESLMEYYGMK